MAIPALFPSHFPSHGAHPCVLPSRFASVRRHWPIRLTSSSPNLSLYLRRWLAAQGRMDESREVLIRYNGEAVGLEILNEIETALALESSVEVARWSDAFKPNDQCFRYRTLLAMGALFAQQATGVNMVRCSRLLNER